MESSSDFILVVEPKFVLIDEMTLHYKKWRKQRVASPAPPDNVSVEVQLNLKSKSRLFFSDYIIASMFPILEHTEESPDSGHILPIIRMSVTKLILSIAIC